MTAARHKATRIALRTIRIPLKKETDQTAEATEKKDQPNGNLCAPSNSRQVAALGGTRIDWQCRFQGRKFHAIAQSPLDAGVDRCSAVFGRKRRRQRAGAKKERGGKPLRPAKDGDPRRGLQIS